MVEKLNSKISIVMSTYNEPLEYITKSIESILNQTFKNFEFIIINDNPVRKELQNFLEKYKNQDKRIILIRNKKNIGLTKSLNKGIKISNGKFIARQDADDISLSKRLQIQYDYLENNETIFLIGSGAININEEDKQIGIYKPITNKEKLKKILEKRNIIYHPTIMFRNEKDNFYREKFKYSQDYDFYLCLLSKGKQLVNIPKVLIKYRINNNSISFLERVKQGLFAKKANEFYHQRLKYKKDNYDEFNPNKILSLNIENSTNKIFLESEIKFSFNLNNFKKSRKLCKRYFKNYSIKNKFLIYYLLSYTGKNFVNLLRKYYNKRKLSTIRNQKYA